MTGGTVFDGAFSALAPFGGMVFYGIAGRAPPKPTQPASLMGAGRAVIGFWLVHCMSRPEMTDAALRELLAMVAEGALHPVGGGRYPQAEVRRAHEDLRARRTTRKLVREPAG
jgi:NADPH:quinone reductase